MPLDSEARTDMASAGSLIIPADWERLAEALEKGRGPLFSVLVVGGVDSGKTTFCKFLVARVCRTGRPVGFVDADMGQPTLGPPGVVGAKICRDLRDASDDDVRPPCLRFVGGASPAGRIFSCVVAARRAVDWAVANGAATVIVDTTGLVAGEIGRELKMRKVELLAPDLVVGIARGDELEHILRPLESLGQPVARLSRCEAAVVRSPAARRRFRLDKFHEYFRDARPLDLPLDRFVVADCPANLAPCFAPDRIVSLQPALDRTAMTDLLVGLEDRHGRCLALGIVQEMNAEDRRLRVLAPPADLSLFRCLRIGRSGIE